MPNPNKTIFEMSEHDMVNNTPFTIFELDGKPVKVRALPSADAEAWLDAAMEASTLDGQIGRIKHAYQQACVRASELGADPSKAAEAQEAESLVVSLATSISTKRKEYCRKLRACVLQFDPTTLTGVVDRVSDAQLNAAYLRMLQVSDPSLLGGWFLRCMGQANLNQPQQK